MQKRTRKMYHTGKPASRRRRALSSARRFLPLFLFLFVFSLLWIGAARGSASAYDRRADAHGISFLRTGSTSGVLIWSDQYEKNRKSRNWNHDVYAQKIDLRDPAIDRKKRITLVSAPEAQEPASASMTANGRIMVTFEDGYNNGDDELSQRYALFDKDLNAIVPYRGLRKHGTTVKSGGHSGHTASTKTRHVVVWSEGWVDGGGANGLGTGKRIGLTTYRSDGRRLFSKSVASGKGRYWWPIAAASSDRVLFLWQKYIKGKTYAQLQCVCYDPVKNRFKTKAATPDRRLKLRYYSYSAVWLSKSRRFLVIASRSDGKANAYLLTESGRVTACRKGLPGIVREASPAVIKKGKTEIAAWPDRKNGATFLRVKNRRIGSSRRVASCFHWSVRGTAGFTDASGDVCFAVLGKDRVKIVRVRSPK
ncbi:MAG: hypothetical protein ACOYJJ_07640 [Anaerovoracaceae bacterium]